MPPLSPPSWQEMEDTLNSTAEEYFREVDQHTQQQQQQQLEHMRAQQLAMPYPQCLEQVPQRVEVLHQTPQRAVTPQLPSASALPGGCASRGSPLSGESFRVLPKGVDPFEAQSAGRVVRTVYRLAERECMAMSRDYYGTVYMNKELFQQADRAYADDVMRCGRDLRRQAHYNSEDPDWLRGGQFLAAHVDMSGVIPGFEDLGKHKILVYLPDDGIDRYGPLYSLDGVLKMLGYRSGGSAAVCLNSMFTSCDSLPLEIRLRTVTLTTQQLKSQKFKERFLDIHALKSFLVAFGYKQQVSSNKTSNSNAAGIRLQFCSELVTIEMSVRILNAPLTDL